MSSTETLLKATLNRLTARLRKGLIDLANDFATVADKAPDKLRKEWDLFQEEVYEEVERLKTEAANNEEAASTNKKSDSSNPQDKIDRLRAKVAELSRKIEAKN